MTDQGMKDFRKALGSFVTGVTIITANDRAGRPVGLTANSFNSVSLDPPMVLWSLDRKSRNIDAFNDATAWAVHVLADDQQDLSNIFARSGDDKFANVPRASGEEGAPLISGCAARFGCEATHKYDGGDHTIFVGRVLNHSMSEKDPLTFHEGRYRRIVSDIDYLRPSTPEHDSEFGLYFLGSFLGRTFNAVTASVNAERKLLDIDRGEYAALTLLSVNDPMPAIDLVKDLTRIGIAQPWALLEGMTARRLVRKAPSGMLELTTTGRSGVTKLMQAAKSSQLRVEELLRPWEIGLLNDFLDRIYEGFDAEPN